MHQRPPWEQAGWQEPPLPDYVPDGLDILAPPRERQQPVQPVEPKRERKVVDGQPQSWLSYAAEQAGAGQLRVTALVVSIRQYPSGWCKAILRPEGGGPRDEFSAVGAMTAQPSNVYDFRGTFTVHAQYGEQFAVTSCELARPASVEGIRSFLEVLPGMGPVRTAKLVAQYGEGTLALLEGDREAALAALVAIDGITQPRAEAILSEYGKRQQDAALHSTLRGYGLTSGQIAKLFASLGTDLLEVIERRPYTIIDQVEGLGFLTIDAIARRAGVPENATERIDAAIVYALRTGAEQGHTWMPDEKITKWCLKELRISTADVAAALERDIAGVSQVESGGKKGRALHTLVQAEREIQACIANAASAPAITAVLDVSVLPRELTEGQRAAVVGLYGARVGVLTGGPGTGKTFTLKALLSAWAGKTVLLAAPTGKAAIRMTESTGQSASTVHRLLEWSQGSFGYNEAFPLVADVVVVDESSMLDVQLASAVLRAVEFESTQLLFVGDVDQLPSVGAGAVLRDLIASGRVPTYRLTEIKRQGEGSSVVHNAARVLAGQQPTRERRTDWMFEVCPEGAAAELVAARVIKAVTSLIPQHFGIASERIQVLSPQSTGGVGVRELNEALRAQLNPGSGSRLRPGDRVIQLSNDYGRQVFNGEVGTVAHADTDGSVVVDFAGRTIAYDQSGATSLVHAWAITIHKSQGSEFDCVVVPLHESHSYMLRRQLIYTAITRAKKLCVLIGTEKAARRAVTNATEFERFTLLRQLLW